jgi:hypothetical protein
MTRRSLLSAIGGVASIGMIGTASAQSTETATPTASSTNRTTASTTSTSGSGSSEPITQIDGDVALVEWEERETEADGETIVAITVDVSAPKAITLTDAFGAFTSSGVNKVDPRTVVGNIGRNTFSETVSTIEEVGGLGVSTEDGGIGISTAEVGGGSGRQTSLLEGVAIGVGTGITGTGIAAWRHTRDDMESPEAIDDDDGGII